MVLLFPYILVTEDSHSRMGGSDVVNSGPFRVTLLLAIHYMALSGFLQLYIGDKHCALYWDTLFSVMGPPGHNVVTLYLVAPPAIM